MVLDFWAIAFTLNNGQNPMFTITFAPRMYMITGSANIAKLISTAEVVFLHLDDTNSITSADRMMNIVRRKATSNTYCHSLKLIG